MGSSLSKIKSGNRNQNENNEKVPVYYNGKISAQVNKEDLLEKSSYFRAITKTCYRDHESDDIDISIPPNVSLKAFKQVINFINTDEIDIHVETLFEILNLALYLQIDDLQKFCLDHFTHNLNRKSLESQLGLLGENSFADEEFMRRALMFRESGRPSFSGLYFLQKAGERTYNLKMFSKHSERAHLISTFTMKNVSSLHLFDNMLCMVEYSYDLREVSLLQYDLISADMSSLTLENAIFSADSKPVICSDKENLFVISNVSKLDVLSGVVNKSLLSLSVFQRQSPTRSLEMLITKTLNPLPGWLSGLNVFFSHCFDGKLYVFYRKYIARPAFFTLRCVYLMTICVETLQILNNKWLTTENIKVKKGTKIEQFVMTKFKKILFHEKQQKLFIKMTNKCFYSSNFWKHVLIFDLKNNCFYSAKNFLPSSLACDEGDKYNYKFTLSGSGSLYGIRYLLERLGSRPTEVRSFQLRNDKLVENGVRWNCLGSARDSTIKSACFV